MHNVTGVIAKRWMLTAVILAVATLFSGEAKSQITTGQTHPYLWFTQEDIPALRAKMENEPFRERLDALKSWWEETYQTRQRQGLFADRRQWRPFVGSATVPAFLYVITGDRQYVRYALEEVNAIFKLDTADVDELANLDGAKISEGVSIVYDWCYDAMTPEERTRYAREAERLLLNHSITAVRDYGPDANPREWPGAMNLDTNWAGVVGSGAALYGLAFMNETPAAKQAAEEAIEHLDRFLHHVTRIDGAGTEGVMYYNYGTAYAWKAMTAAIRITGDDHGLIYTYTDRLAGYWNIYLQAPSGLFANFCNMNENTFEGLWGPDNIEGGPNGTLSALYESFVPGGDPLLLWGADHGGASYWLGGVDPLWFVFRRGDAPKQETRPPLQDAVHFRGVRQAVWQSGRIWFAYHAGWSCFRSHYNCDLGTFILEIDGERMVHDPGYGTTDTAMHSCVLVDGEGQKQGVSSRWLWYGAGDTFNYLASDLSRCYPNEAESMVRRMDDELFDGTPLKKYHRHVVMVKGEYLVFLDQLDAGWPVDWEWRLQTKLPVTTGDMQATVRGETSRLRVSSFATQPMATSVVSSQPERGNTFNSLRFATSAPCESLDIVTVLHPDRNVSISWDGRGRLTVDGEQLVFTETGYGLKLVSVNGENVEGNIHDGYEVRTLERVSAAQ